mmetsp:Transcript_673/g.2570  ORF Transcript_673/g.2570 Transcript_673/m.2570 type:complete len:210 (-) Transcript_673:374-1003(-)
MFDVHGLAALLRILALSLHRAAEGRCELPGRVARLPRFRREHLVFQVGGGGARVAVQANLLGVAEHRVFRAPRARVVRHLRVGHGTRPAGRVAHIAAQRPLAPACLALFAQVLLAARQELQRVSFHLLLLVAASPTTQALPSGLGVVRRDRGGRPGSGCRRRRVRFERKLRVREVRGRLGQSDLLGTVGGPMARACGPRRHRRRSRSES